MGEACVSEKWDHTSALLAMLLNVHNTSKSARVVLPSEFHPCSSAPPQRRIDDFGEIRHLFPEDKKNEKK